LKQVQQDKYFCFYLFARIKNSHCRV